jgi:Flp pilus assembly protein TadD
LASGFKHSRWIFLACALIALSACDSLGLDGDASATAEEAPNPVREALASQGSVDDANRALDAKDYQRAYNILRQHLVRNPSDDAAKLSLARTYLGRGEGRNAQTILDSLSDDAKEAPQAKMVRGLALLIVGERVEAVAQLETALEGDPTLWQAANGLGLIHDFERRWDEAETSYQLALEKKNDTAVVHNNLGYSYLLQGRVEEATKAFMAALSYEPDLIVARSNLRLALAAKGRYTDAAAGIDKAGLPQVLNNIGYVAMLRGDFESAGVFFQRAIAESPVYYDTAEENLERLEALTGKSVDETPRPIRGIGN